MKLNRSNLFLLIWATHLLVYSTTYHISIRVVFNDYREFYNVFLGFLSGLMGWFEQIPAFFVIPILIMLLLTRTKLKQHWFLAYTISIGISYLGNYLWLFSINTHDKILFSDKTINLIYFIIPSLIISILCNWLIFKKTYKKLNI